MSNNNIEKKINEKLVEELRGGYVNNTGGPDFQNLSNAGMWGGGYGIYNHIDNHSDINYNSGWYNGTYYDMDKNDNVNWSPKNVR